MKRNCLLVLLCLCFISVAQTTPGSYEIKNLDINTKYTDFGTSFYGDSIVIFSAPKKRNRVIKNLWEPNQQPYLDLYQGKRNKNGEIQHKEKFSTALNSRFHEANIVFTKDLKTAYFTRNNIYDNKIQNDSLGALKLQLFKAVVDTKGNWSKIEKLPFNSDQFSTGHPALSKDEKKLYFVSDRPGAIGNTDVFYVTINDDGTYGEPVNLGADINTELKEVFPFIDDNGLLYFSSEGHNSKGGLDIFAVKEYANSYSKPLNLGEPINTVDDDFSFVIDKSNEAGYFSSNRKGGKGDDDIYAFKVLEPLKIECKQVIIGAVINTAREKLGGATVILLDNEFNEIQELKTKEDGIYQFEVDCETAYTVKATLADYELTEKQLTTNNDFEKVNTIPLVLNKKPIDYAKTIKFNPIYFDYNKSNIKPNAKKTLLSVIDTLKLYPKLKIEILSHTDTRGSTKYNERLSKRRANSTVDFIVKIGGIDKNRVIGKWLGETHAIINCERPTKCSEKEHQQNRRSEFIISE